MKINTARITRRIALEWLWFFGTYGGVFILALRTLRTPDSPSSGEYFGIYLFVLFVRVTFWAIKTVRKKPDATQSVPPKHPDNPA